MKCLQFNRFRGVVTPSGRHPFRLLDLTGVVFTFDALHCQKKTLSAIAHSGNDYLVKVKANQPKLYQQIETESKQQIPKQTVEDHEKTRNRQSYRKIEVFEPPEKLDPKWIGVGCVIKPTFRTSNCINSDYEVRS